MREFAGADGLSGAGAKAEYNALLDAIVKAQEWIEAGEKGLYQQESAFEQLKRDVTPRPVTAGGGRGSVTHGCRLCCEDP
ncbi:hypothetical protein ACIBK9_34735 [Nonomuraea sp. NPDC050227]|uniref:hypothetical protein n=1 Tax=Nonomuraea sp. NPDC050227 TaxID=3364360 RepID=UPI00379A6BDF